MVAPDDDSYRSCPQIKFQFARPGELAKSVRQSLSRQDFQIFFTDGQWNLVHFAVSRPRYRPIHKDDMMP